MRVLRSAAILLPVLVLASACGDATTADTDPTTTAAGTGPSTSVAGTAPGTGGPAKPEVKPPATQPTELVITDLTTGTGPGAAAGDTVVLYYVGVRSENGEEFDSSYGAEPFTLQLGTGSVIQGWEDGLLGVQQGGQRRLDIPNDLAYGDQDRGIIKAGDALTFVVDVIAVIPASDPADEPKITVAGAANVPEVVTTDLVEGTGPEPAQGSTVAIHIIAYRADTGEVLNSTWQGGAPVSFVLGDSQIISGFNTIVTGMKVGGRRQGTIPFADAFGEAGNADLGLPASTDLVVVIDLVATY